MHKNNNIFLCETNIFLKIKKTIYFFKKICYNLFVYCAVEEQNNQYLISRKSVERINAFMNDKNRKILTVALFALLALLIVGIIVVCVLLNVDNDDEDNKIVPDYPPQATDPNQSPMENDPGGKLETSEGGAGVNLTYTATATVDLSEGVVKLYYANPSRSTQDMVVTLILDNENKDIVCRSQKITPGNQVKELPLNEEIKDLLEVGAGYKAKYVVGCYNPETSEKAIVELEGGGVVLTVVE